MRIVLLEPEIPQNTGNIARMAAATGIELVLVGKLGFFLSDKHARRAGMDYWDKVNYSTVPILQDFYPQIDANCALISTKADQLYTEIPDNVDTLIFGNESSGLPAELYGKHSRQLYRIPMQQGIRSLNLATSAGIVLYHLLARQGFIGLE
jgi:tRNA (cytidine/uridine-2'-O-)-methyltransferase